MSAPRVRILLLNWNNAGDTIECLASVFALDYPRFDVVLCDNASTDDSLARVRSWVRERFPGVPAASIDYDRATAEAGGRPDDADIPLKIVQTGGNLGFAGGNNVGLRYVLARHDSDYVWLLNNDTVTAPGALRALVERAEADPALAAVGATMLEYRAPDVVQMFAGGNVSPWHGMVALIGQGLPAAAPRPALARLDYISGGCMLVRVGTLERVGLLDADRFFLYGEDADWCERMRRAGATLGFAPGAEVWHKGAGTAVAGSAGHEYHNVLSPLLLIQKHRPARVPVAVAYSLYRCLAPKVVRLQGRRLVAVLRAYRDFARRLLAPPPTSRAA